MALFCQKLNLHGKQLLGQGAEGPSGGWACLPQAWVLALLAWEGGKTLGADSQLLRTVGQGSHLLWVHFVPGKMRVWMKSSEL